MKGTASSKGKSLCLYYLFLWTLFYFFSFTQFSGCHRFVNNDGPCNPFIVMEYIRGTTLEHFIMKGNNQPSFNITRQTLSIAHAVSNALLYLHNKNLVHRDVKPANIFFTRVAQGNVPGIIKLGDFGVVKWGDFKASMTTGSLTVTGQHGLGTWKYMAPEQATQPKGVSVRGSILIYL
jgi:serine/threonine protein kinase